MENQIEFSDSPVQGGGQWSQESHVQGNVPPSEGSLGGGQNPGHGPAMHLFVYLIYFISLSFLTSGIGAILFQMINKFTIEPSLANIIGDNFSQFAIKYGIASVIVAAPLFFFVGHYLNKYLKEGEIDRDSKIRKFLTYLVLFIAAVIVIGDLITLIFNFLDGDLVVRFTLKALVVLIIAASVFGYYFWDIRREDFVASDHLRKMIARAVAGVTFLVFVASFFVVDSPMEARNMKIDNNTVSNLNSIQNSVENYYRQNAVLPKNLEELQSTNLYTPYLREDGSNITYEKTSDSAYRLCGEFKRSNLVDEDNSSYYGKEWKHGEGKQCFTKNVSSIKTDSVNDKLNIKTPPSQMQPQTGFDPAVMMEESRARANRAALKSVMSSAMPMVIICQDDGGTVVSGSGGEDMCSGASGELEMAYEWPTLSQCSSVKWFVKNGDNENWDYTMECSGLPDCNGPLNAICNQSGCKFSGTCS